MAVTPANRRLPLTHVYYNVTLPATGSKLTLTNGVPGTGVEVGALDGPIEWTPGQSLMPFESETHNVPLDYDIDERTLEMTIRMKEILGVNLEVATNGDLIVAPDGMKVIRIGSGNPLTSYSWVAVWETRAGTQQYEHAIIYDGVVDGAVNLGLSRKDYTVIEMTIKAKPVLTRPTGDDLGYITVLS